MTAAHSRLAPSSAHVWVPCPGSVQLSEQFPELLADPAAAEGVAAHWVAHAMLTSHTPSEGDLTDEGEVVTEEMIDGARIYVNLIFSLVNEHGGLARARLEKAEKMPSLHAEMWGTPDCSIDNLEVTAELHVVDYKFGHRQVDPFENWQLMAYLRGVLDRLDMDGKAEQYATAVLHVVQPRCYTVSGPVRQWRVKVADLRGYFNQLRMSATEALSGNAKFRPGPHCRDCTGRRACEVLKCESERIMDDVSRPQPVELPPDALGLQLNYITRAEEMLKAARTGLEQQAESLIRSGAGVPGWGMKPGKSKLTWTVPPKDVQSLGEILEVSLMKEPSPITPTQAIGELKKAGIDTDVIDAYSKRESGAMRLEIDDTIQAKKVFSQ